MRRTALGLLGALLLPSWAHAQDSSVCYEVERSAWEPALALGADTILTGLPSRVSLSGRDEQGRSGEGRFDLEVAPGALPSSHSIRQWWREGEELRLLWSNGFSGVGAKLTPSKDGFQGAARTFWDFERETQEARLTLREIDCSFPHDPDRVTQTSMPRSLVVVDGPELALGAPISGVDGLEQGRGRRSRYLRDVSLEGIGQVVDLRVTPTEGGVIRLLVARLAGSFNKDEFVATTEARLGPVGTGDTLVHDSIQSQTLGWQNRETRLVLIGSRVADRLWEWSLVLSDPTLGHR